MIDKENEEVIVLAYLFQSRMESADPRPTGRAYGGKACQV